MGDKNDYLQIVKDTIDCALQWYPAMEKELPDNRPIEILRDPHDYMGVYWNAVGTVHIDISYSNGQLRLAFQGLDDEVWDLRH